ncbi:MAG: HAMP domain-containing protein, partial [Actinobacteria bacterium]
MQHGIDAVQHVVTRTEVNLESDRRQDVLFFGLSVAGIILGVLLLAWSVVRSVNRPLRALTASARDLSEHRLPALVDSLHKGADVIATQLDSLTPIEVQSEDELGELANAFNSVQQTTANVARQQVELLRKGIGDLYVTDEGLGMDDERLAWANATLARPPTPGLSLSRTLGLLVVAHLATRMRRNAENLLVMSGADQPRQWRESVPIIDVVRAAAAEIADFSRVTFYGFDEAVAVTGNAVSDCTHLLAEL